MGWRRPDGAGTLRKGTTWIRRFLYQRGRTNRCGTGYIRARHLRGRPATGGIPILGLARTIPVVLSTADHRHDRALQDHRITDLPCGPGEGKERTGPDQEETVDC